MRRLVPGLALVLAVVSFPSFAAAQYPYPPPPPPPYPAYAAEANLRIVVKPKEADVYVDGYFAGKVEDYDGTFQRLHVEAGQHEIVIHLDGYRSLHQQLYLSANVTRKIEGTLAHLAPGEAPEPVPVPAPRTETRAGDPRDMPPPRSTGPRRGPSSPPSPPEPHSPASPPSPRSPDGSRPAPATTSGSLSIRVQPDNTTVLIDGERWSGPSSSDEQLIVQVPEGRHHIEVRRDGFETFSAEVDVRAGQTEPLNISLTRAR